MLRNEESIIPWQAFYYTVAYVKQIHVSILLGCTTSEGYGPLIPTSKVVWSGKKRQTHHDVSG